MSSTVKVAVRVRPLNQREKDLNSNVIVRMEGQQTTLGNLKNSNVESRHILERTKLNPKRFVYDYSYWSAGRNDPHYTSQEQVFKDLGTLVLDAAFEGYNACVFAYGQTGAGKTYTMMGDKQDPGLIPRICKGLYGKVSDNSNEQESCRIEVSYVEIYNEQVLDLLRPPCPDQRDRSAARLKVREHPKDGPYVEGLTKHDAPDNDTLESFLNQGNNLRTTAATRMNDQSSRSHAIFTIKFTQAKFVAGLPSEITSKINLVDLAGSERVAKSGATGDRLKEGGNINKSLTTLGLVISTLAERSSRTDPTQKRLFIPYRDSVLTWLLKDSLGGNSKTIMIAAISPSDSSYGETLSTLRYADRAKNIINAPTVNEDPNVRLIRELKAEIERLKSIIAGDKSQIPSSSSVENVDQAQRLLEGTESKMEKHLRDWAEKWRDTLHIIEESDLGLHKNRSALRIDVDPPHLVLLDDDPLNTSITIFSLKEGENLIGNSNAVKEQDLVIDAEGIENEHCVLTYDTSKVILIRKDGRCQVNKKVVDESIKLSQGDIIFLGQEIRLKFNFPQEASLLRERRRCLTGSSDSFSFKGSTPTILEEKCSDDLPLSPLTDESGVELDVSEQHEESGRSPISPLSVELEVFDDGESERKTIDDLRCQVEELLAKYKESEIERFEAEKRNKIALEEKEKEIENQTRKLLELQKNDEVLLQQHQKNLQTLREQLSEQKNSTRTELAEEMDKLFDNLRSTNKEITDMSKRDLEKYRKTLDEQLKRQWSKLDQYEMKLIEVEAEKRMVSKEAEIRLKKERTKSEEERKRRLEDIEGEKRKIQEILEGHIQQRESAREEHELKEKEADRCMKKLEQGTDDLITNIRELEWLQYRLCTDEESVRKEDVPELVQTVKILTKEVEVLQDENEKDMEKYARIQTELLEKARVLESCEEKVNETMTELADVRKNLVDCQQRFGEELGNIVNTVYEERDVELEKIESEKEMLMSQHLEHQRALEVLVNDSFEKLGDEDDPSVKELRAKVVQLVRCASPGLETNSLQSEIIEKKLQIHDQQMKLGEKEEERRTLHDKREQQFLALSREVQAERETEQNELIEAIRALQLLMESEGNEDSAGYFESESSSLMNAQRHILDLDKQITEKVRERREIEKQLESLQLQVELQAESSQEQFHDALEELKRRLKKKDKEIEEMKKALQIQADQYITRLRREPFVVLDKPIVSSCYMKVGSEAVDEILKEIASASHVPELAESYRSVTQDCNGWRYEEKEKDVDLLRKEGTNDNIHCFLGRGIIRAPPHSIFQAVSNPLSRFVYDRMLKNIRIVENIADELRIVHMLHETSHCFMKHARDFCFVTLDTEKDGKFIAACQSVEHPSCPEVKGVIRAKIISSGWVIEPKTVRGEKCSLVWYLTRVYLGKSIPSKLVNLVSKRQPLSIAYLREYLVSEKL